MNQKHKASQIPLDISGIKHIYSHGYLSPLICHTLSLRHSKPVNRLFYLTKVENDMCPLHDGT